MKRTITLKKVYHEVWTRKRGSSQSVFSGHTTEYFIDGVPIQKKDYQDRISEIAGDEGVFRLLTSPTTFPAMHWQKQRALLLDICGDITDADVIASDEKLAPLPAILGNRKLDDYKKVIAARKSEINKELTALPVRIDEQRRSLPDVTGLDRSAIINEIPTLETEINDLKLKLQGVDTGGGIAELSKRLAGINADIQKMESAHYSAIMASVNGITLQYNDVSNALYQDKRKQSDIHGELKAKESRIRTIIDELELMRSQWSVIDAEAFQDTTISTCPSCGQALPDNRVQEAHESAKSTFNVSKSNRLEDITKRGHRLAEDRDRVNSEIVALRQELAAVESGIPENESKLKTLGEERDLLRKQAEDYSGIADLQELRLQSSSIQLQIETERSGHAWDRGSIQDDIRVKTSLLSAVKENADRFVRRETGEKRIETLKADEKTLASEFERLESELFLCEQFIRMKVQLLTGRINSRFEMVRFKLFSEQVNGGLAESCEITVNGIPFNGGLNNAARINAGLDVCRTLSEHYGLRVPIFVDNAESVCRLLDMQAQVIRLIVSEQDAILRVEHSRQAVAA